MDKRQKAELLSKADATKFNTTNAWGFGGSTGTDYTFPNGVKLRKANAHYRHTKSSAYCILYGQDGKRVFEVSRMTKEHWEIVSEYANR